MTPSSRIALVTCAELPEPDVDEPLLGAALSRCGLTPHVVPWDDPSISWDSFDAAVLRSCWNYHEPGKRESFLRWLTHVHTSTCLLNPLHVVQWNISKQYLLQLAQAGISVVPTRVIRRGDSLDAPLEWNRVVVKPVVSAGSRDTHVIKHKSNEWPKEILALSNREDLLVQQYVASVDGHGERCLVWIANELMHAIRKEPRFAGQDEHVSLTEVEITPREAAFASDVLDAASSCGGFSRNDLLYARVDIALDENHEPMLMELELIEPSLFLAQSNRTLDAFARAITLRAPSRI